MYPPIDIGEKFRIVHPEQVGSSGSRLELIMQRGAFGSGEHETTASCLAILETLPDLKGRKILDLGSGTGILAIAALKMGAAHALCVDLEPAAVKTAQRNCRLNDVADRTEHLCGTLADVDQDGFDLVLANIYGDILLAVAASLIGKTEAGGNLLLSGIPWEDNFAVRQAYLSRSCRLLQNRMLDEFSTLWLEKLAPGVTT